MARDTELHNFCYDLYKKGQLVDLTFVCQDDQSIKVHGLIMAAYSSYIRAFLLQVNDLHHIGASITCKDYSVSVVQMLAEYVYTGGFSSYDTADLVSLMALARTLEMEDVLENAENALMKSNDLVKVEGKIKCESCMEPFENQEEYHDHALKCDVIKESSDSISASTSDVHDSECNIGQEDDGTDSASPSPSKKARMMKPKTGPKPEETVSVKGGLVCMKCRREFHSARQIQKHRCWSPTVTVMWAEQIEVKREDQPAVTTAKKCARGRKRKCLNVKETNETESPTKTSASSCEITDDLNVSCEVKDENETQPEDLNTVAETETLDNEIECYSCEIEGCEFSTNKQRYISDHLRYAHGDMIMPCPYCKTELKRRELFAHKKTCPQKQDYIVSLEAKSENGRFKCVYCNFETAKSRYLNDHVVRNHGEIKLKCEFCQEAIARKDLFRHKKHCSDRSHNSTEDKRTGPETKKVYICKGPECEFKTEVIAELREHKKMVHGSKKVRGQGNLCDVCGRSCSSYSALKRHKQSAHQTVRAYKCNQCEYSGKTEALLLNHLRIIHGVNLDGSHYEKKFPCEHCEFTGIHKSALLRHIADKHEKSKQIQCELCGYTTSRKDSLKKHMRAKHQSFRKPRVCKVCHKEFLSESGWRRHMLSHVGTKPYNCRECGKEFMVEGEYTNHVLVKHRQIKPYSCHLCDYACVKRQTMMTHLWNAHSYKGELKVNPRASKGNSLGKTHFKYRYKELTDLDKFLSENTQAGDEKEVVEASEVVQLETDLDNITFVLDERETLDEQETAEIDANIQKATEMLKVMGGQTAIITPEGMSAESILAQLPQQQVKVVMDEGGQFVVQEDADEPGTMYYIQVQPAGS